MDPAAILARIDAIAEALAELRREVADQGGLEGVKNGPCGSASALNGAEAPDDWLEISTAVARYNRPADTLRYWCRHEGVGTKLGGRWLISPARLRARLERE